MTKILAFSGGPDSMYLLHKLLEKNQKPILAHLNHGLRGVESDKDEAFCKRIAKKHNLKIETEKVQLKKGSEEEARNVRYDFLERVRKKHKATKVLTAHHLNDNIETVLFNLTRGTGLNGLKGIPSNQIKRPLLETTKEEILTYLKKHKIKYREDLSNRSTKFSRNRIRLKVIPELKKINPNLEKTFLGNLVNFKSAQDFLDQESKKHIQKDHIKIADFKKLHPALQTNILLRLAGPNIAQKNIEEVRKLILKARTGTKKNLGQTKVEIQYGKAMFNHIKPSFNVSFKILKKHPADLKAPKNKHTYLNFDKIKSINSLHTTPYIPGARITPLGLKGRSQKLQDIFTNKKIPKSIREEIPIITFEDKIIAVGWLVISETFKVTPATKQILKIIFKDTK